MTHRTPFAYYIGDNPRFKHDKLYHLLILDKKEEIVVLYCETTLSYKNDKEFLLDWLLT